MSIAHYILAGTYCSVYGQSVQTIKSYRNAQIPPPPCLTHISHLLGTYSYVSSVSLGRECDLSEEPFGTLGKCKGKGQLCTGTEALYRPYGP